MENYICNDCGEVFPESDIYVKEELEPRGEFWGSPAREKFVYRLCPCCNSENIQPYDDFEDFLDEDEF